ncbi:hypothetical protein ATI61_10425 [Archangium gephyra]|uniref:Uncharacterized protein n=1 Tax=Archangium gephyra TaxID=48 RepID=A0AAC8Q3Q2_9BACT|nr:hypothetical protein [Archangium gephyra]AKJ00565.1 Hypothetical protein AA314_02191 [Archangium gephyra]REG32738.1 hypothetical protein ATI61_10425 [Archangium gephyra]
MSTTTLDLFNTPRLELARLRRRYFLHVYSEAEGRFRRGGGVDAVELRDGGLWVDGERMAQTRFGPRSVRWAHEQPTGGRMTGLLHFSPDGLECSGTLSVSGPGAAATETRYDVFGGVVPHCVYATRLTTSRQPAGTSPGSVPTNAWTGGLTLTLGYTETPGSPLPTAKITLNDQDVSNYVALSVPNADDQLHLKLVGESLASVLCTFDARLYLSAEIVFSDFGETFSGQVTATCSDQAGPGAYLWTGGVVGQSAAAKAHVQAAPMQQVQRGAASAGRSLGELLTLVPDESVSERAHTLLVENMKWAMAQSDAEKGWLTTFFAQTPPVLSPSQEAIARQALDWYTSRFSIAYLTNALDNLQGAGAPSVRLDDAQRARLDYYLREGLAAESAFNLQLTQLDSAAYLECVTRLQAYVNDPGSGWAEQVYAVVTSNAQLTLLLNRVKASRDMSSANAFAALLQVLDPSGGYASRYAQAIASRVLLDATFQTRVSDKDVTMSWMPDALEAFCAASAGADADWRAAADALTTAATGFGGFTNLASQFADFLIAASGDDFRAQSGQAREAFATRYPTLAKAADTLFLISWIGGLFNVVVSFVNWNEQSPTQKASLITSCVDLAGKAVDRVAGLLKGELTLDEWNQLNQWASSNVAMDDFAQINRDAADVEDADWVRVGVDETAGLFDAESKTVAVAGTRWARIYDNAARVVAVVGIATSAVFTVLSTIDFVNDLKEGRPVTQTTLDGIVMVSNAITSVCLVLDLALSMAIFALAAAVFAIVGLIVSLILAFLPTPTSENPSSQFMRETGIPFVDNLPSPPLPSAPRPRLVFHPAG